MNRVVTAGLLTFLLALSPTAVSRAQDTVPNAPAHTDDPRAYLSLVGEWQFKKIDPSAAGQNMATSLNDSDWQTVTVPHCWNALDGEDGGNNYWRGTCWYRRHIVLPASFAGKQLFIRFQGAFQTAAVYVNGKKLGEHEGGFAAFCYDATAALHPGDNTVAVTVSNVQDTNIPPWDADFTFFGGIYRPAEIIAVAPTHIPLTDYASPGVYITTPVVTPEAARVHIRTLVESPADAPAGVQLACDILDASGKIAASSNEPVTLTPGKRQEIATDISLPTPHLWNGRPDPYLYTVRVRLLTAPSTGQGQVLDQVTQPLGVRTFAVDARKGFLLNGKPYALHGVDRHQDRLDKGWAISDDDTRQDMGFIREMGCTAVRLAHYQQCDLIYQLCDQYGIVVWAEIPVVNRLSNTPAFYANARQQYIELIRQNMNHPSIMFWSAGNEQFLNQPNVRGYFRDMNTLAHQEDPSRLSALAERAKDPLPGLMDVYGLNEYWGWYDGTTADLAPWLAKQAPKMAITEYGAGASIYFHSEHPVVMDHTEEYQCLFHEASWGVLKQHPEIWGTFIWNMFDFAVDKRAEGDHAGRNDKGLVTYDRKTRKDAFFFYKANWSDEPVMHINSKRFTVRGLQAIPIKVYANTPYVELFVNGQSLGKQSGTNAVFMWKNVPLKVGPNAVRAVGVHDGKQIADDCTWTYTPGAPQAVYVAQDATMRKALEAHPPRR